MSKITPSQSSSPNRESSPRFQESKRVNSNARAHDAEADDEVRCGSPVKQESTHWSVYSSNPPTYRRDSQAQKVISTSWEMGLPQISKCVPSFQGGFHAKAAAFSRKLDETLQMVNNRSSVQVTQQCHAAVPLPKFDKT